MSTYESNCWVSGHELNSAIREIIPPSDWTKLAVYEEVSFAHQLVNVWYLRSFFAGRNISFRSLARLKS